MKGVFIENLQDPCPHRRQRFINFNAVLVDDTDIFIGDCVMLELNVTIAAASHSIDLEPRREGVQYNLPVRIGDNVWLGAGYGAPRPGINAR